MFMKKLVFVWQFEQLFQLSAPLTYNIPMLYYPNGSAEYPEYACVINIPSAIVLRVWDECGLDNTFVGV